VVSGAGRFVDAAACASELLPTLRDLGFAAGFDSPPASETAAQRQLARFMDGPVYGYGETRSGLAPEPFAPDATLLTSVLSPYLRFGLLSPRRAYHAARAAYGAAADDQARKSVETWVNEIVWREFYMHILYHFPHVSAGNFRRTYDALVWRDAPDELERWKQGQTGYPVVDAAMRQLVAVGWLPNRARMIVASFLSKDLLIDWREGEAYFMQRLVDGDPAANNGGWQWTAGTGTDAQPYFRIFNPVSQARKFDPQGAYIRRWVPELRAVPDTFIHAPWEMPAPPRGYPPPMVDHGFARERALAAFGAVKKDE
jgi:deoxyribodipyrimidine photo-lyase